MNDVDHRDVLRTRRLTTPCTPRPMRRAVLHSVICLWACLAVGCYESAFPLDPAPQAEIDSRLPGAWHCVTSDPGDRDLTLTITPTSDRVYGVTIQEFGRELDKYEAHASVLGGATLVNLRNLKPSTKPWIFARYALLNSRVLQVQVVDDHAMKDVDGSPLAVRRAIEGRIRNPALFADVCTCVRMNAE